MSAHIFDRIDDLVIAAKQLGLPHARLYLGPVKMQEFEKALAEFQMSACATNSTFKGMKVVASSKPGMSVGQ